MQSALRRGLAAALAVAATVALAGAASAAAKKPAPKKAAATATYVVGVRSVKVAGKAEDVLVDAQGHTLYYFTKDTPTKVACLGPCAKIWPPLVVKAGTTVTGAKGVTGKFTLLKDVYGLQVEYQGHPLYLYAGDKAAGQANGQGIKGVWFVATPSLTAASTTSSSTASAAATYVVGVRSVKVAGKAEDVLVDAQGRTLYYFTKDTPTKVACLGPCAKIWPPLVVKAGTTVTGAKGVTGKFTLLKDVSGLQVEYQGHPLYLYAGDKAAGQANGQGFKGVWWVATPSLKDAPGAASAKAPAKAAATTSGSGW
jgi:predicted lipoprotein with Yx(FWY)xxD motif